MTNRAFRKKNQASMGFEPMPLFVQNVFYQLSYEAINSGTIKIIVHVAGHISKFYIPMKR